MTHLPPMTLMPKATDLAEVPLPEQKPHRQGYRSEPKIIDLFCGAGGLSLGLKRAGFSTALAVDNWPAARETFVCNFPHTPFLLADMAQLKGADLLGASNIRDDKLPTLIVGGPPCQGFSSAGRRKPKDPRNTLIGTFARLVAELMPPFFLFENVEGFLTTGRGSAIFALLDPILEAGYQTHLCKVNAGNYGVPQLRKRVFAVGALSMNPSFPTPTHAAYGAPGAHLGGSAFPRTPTIQETIGDLKDVSLCVNGHIREPLEGIDLERCTILKPGQTMRDLPIHLQHESYVRRANRRVMDGMPTERRGGPPAGLRRLRSNEPSKTITGSAVNEFLHPSDDRFLTIRECARLQTFPDKFDFVGTKREQSLLIGNAVPPLLAEVFGRLLFRDVQNHQREKMPSLKGELLTFSPTLSTGMSPILSEIVALVQKRYGAGKLDEVETLLLFNA